MKISIVFTFVFCSLNAISQIPSKWIEDKPDSPAYELEQIKMYSDSILFGNSDQKYVFYYWRGINKKRLSDDKGALSDFNKSILLHEDNCSAIGAKGSILF